MFAGEPANDKEGIVSDDAPIIPITTPAPQRSLMSVSGVCGCARHTCWHQRECRSSAYVRIERVPTPRTAASWVVLCRECAAPTRRQRTA